MGLYKNYKNKRILDKINDLNNNKLQIQGQVYGIYRCLLPINYDKIELPDNVISKIHLYSDDGTMEVFLINNNNEKFAVVDCFMSEKMLQEKEEYDKKRENNIQEQDMLDKTMQIKLSKIKDKMIETRYNKYVSFLLENGAKKSIVEMPAIKKLIYNLIERADFNVVMEGQSPIAYQKPNDDGTFNIFGRTDGPLVNIIYKMSYPNDGDNNHYLRLDCCKKIDDEFIETETIYIDSFGEVINNKER